MRLVAAAEAVDDAKAALEEKLVKSLWGGPGRPGVIHRRQRLRESMWRNFGHHHNEVLRDLPSEKQPRVRVPREGLCIPRVQVRCRNVSGTASTPTRCRSCARAAYWAAVQSPDRPG